MVESTHVWRAPLGYRILGILFAVVMIGGALLPWSDGMTTIPPDGSGDYKHDFGYRIALFAVAALFIAWPNRARMELRQGDIVMRHLLWSRRIPLTEIASVTAGRNGLSFQTCDGLTYLSPMGIGQKAPLASWLHRRTRADVIADMIMSARP